MSAATTPVLSKLMEYYHSSPNMTEGLFDQTISPWWESGSIFQTYMDFARYTKSMKYKDFVSKALVENSYGEVHDFLGTNHSFVSVVVGRWNDDVEWYDQAAASGAELHGPETFMSGLNGNGTWISLAQRTIDEVYDYWADESEGGIYWSTDPSQYATYKSGITQLEFISLAARTYLMTRNATLLHITEKLFNWVDHSGMIDLKTVIVNDGVDTVGCYVSPSQRSYSYGACPSKLQFLVGLSFLCRATGNHSYLEYTKTITATAIQQFAPAGVAEKPCEAAGNSNQDMQGFKAIFLRCLAYLFRTTDDARLKSSISTVIMKSAEAALATCNSSWHCKGSWTNSSTRIYPALRPKHLVRAALVTAEGLKGA